VNLFLNRLKANRQYLFAAPLYHVLNSVYCNFGQRTFEPSAKQCQLMIDKDSFLFLRAATSGVARGITSEGTLMELLLVILLFIAYCDKRAQSGRGLRGLKLLP